MDDAEPRIHADRSRLALVHGGRLPWRPSPEGGVERRWLEVLFSMSYGNPEHRRMMDLEGLKEWLPGRVSGFGPLAEAVERQRYFEPG